MSPLPPPLTMDAVLRLIIRPMYDLLPIGMQSRAAEVMMLAIGGQESGFATRRQHGGPARGFWQFEQGGGVRGVLRHPSTRTVAVRVCKALGYAADQATVYNALDDDDALAAAFARLLLYSDPAKLPAIGEPDQAWALYIRTWRPGKAHRERWDENYRAAVTAVTGDLPEAGK